MEKANRSVRHVLWNTQVVAQARDKLEPEAARQLRDAGRREKRENLALEETTSGAVEQRERIADKLRPVVPFEAL